MYIVLNRNLYRIQPISSLYSQNRLFGQESQVSRGTLSLGWNLSNALSDYIVLEECVYRVIPSGGADTARVINLEERARFGLADTRPSKEVFENLTRGERTGVL